jgi:hypothetical protein
MFRTFFGIFSFFIPKNVTYPYNSVIYSFLPSVLIFKFSLIFSFRILSNCVCFYTPYKVHLCCC